MGNQSLYSHSLENPEELIYEAINDNDGEKFARVYKNHFEYPYPIREMVIDILTNFSYECFEVIIKDLVRLYENDKENIEYKLLIKIFTLDIVYNYISNCGDERYLDFIQLLKRYESKSSLYDLKSIIKDEYEYFSTNDKDFLTIYKSINSDDKSNKDKPSLD